jgi:NTE family protein
VKAVKLFYSKKETAPIQHIVVVVVNASTTAVTKIGSSDEIPSIFDVLTAVTDIQLHLYNTESNTLLRDELVQLVETLSKADSAIQPYFIEVSIEDVEDPEKSLYLNEIPTSFSLEKEQADTVIVVGRQLLRQNEEFRRLLTNLGAKPAGDDQLQ